MRFPFVLTLGVLWLAAPPTRAAGGDDFNEGLRLYRAGKHAEAYEVFKKAAAAGEASPELQYNEAISAWQAGLDHEAEAAAEKAAASGGSVFVHARDFLRGNIAFRRSGNIEKTADMATAQMSNGATGPAGPAGPGNPNNSANPGGAPPQPPDPVEAYDRAIAQAEIARDAWIAAANHEPSSLAAPEAGSAARNAERAILKIEELMKKREEAQKEKEKQQKEKEQKEKEQDKDKDKDKKDDPNKDKDKQDKNEDKKDDPQSRPESKPSQDQNKKDPSEKKDPKPDESKKEQQPQEQDPSQLTQAQVQRMLDKLDDKEKQRQMLVRKSARVVRVAKDW